MSGDYPVFNSHYDSQRRDSISKKLHPPYPRVEENYSVSGESGAIESAIDHLITKCCCCFNISFGHDMKDIVYSNMIDLDPIHKQLFISRYIKTTQHTEIKARLVSFSYFVLVTITIILGVAVPAIMSLSADSDRVWYWVTWTFSLILAIINGFIGTFKIQKEYIVLNSVLVRLKGEGWAFLELCGSYGTPVNRDDGSGETEPATHRNKIQKFFYRIENLKQKQFIAEFSESAQDSRSNRNVQHSRPNNRGSGGSNGSNDGLISDIMLKKMSIQSMVEPVRKNKIRKIQEVDEENWEEKSNSSEESLSVIIEKDGNPPAKENE